jgi:hypothetical protein
MKAWRLGYDSFTFRSKSILRSLMVNLEMLRYGRSIQLTVAF